MKREQHQIVHNNKIALHKHSAALHIVTEKGAVLNCVTLKNAISNSEILNQCNIKKTVQHLTV